MAASQIGICNSALVKIGAARISSLSDPTKSAQLLTEQFDKLRLAVLRAHPWNFAKKRAQLSQLSTAPVFEYAFQYQLPNDCVRVLKTTDPDDKYKIEGGVLLTDEPSINILYIADITDYSIWDASALEALACRIAVDLAYSLINNANMAQGMMQAYQAQLKEARQMNAMEGTPDDLVTDDWINARF